MNKKNPFSHHPGYHSFAKNQHEQPDIPHSSEQTTVPFHPIDDDIQNTPPPFPGLNNNFHDLFPNGLEEDMGMSAEPESPVNTISHEELEAACKERICPSCPIKKEADEAHLRAMADLENAKKRLAKEREDMKRFATEGVLSDIIPALDNLDLALLHAPTEGPGKDFVMGVDMTKKLLIEALKKHGLEEIGQLGQAFDPSIHEAVGVADVAEIPNDHVCNLLSKGYSLHGRLLRPARVTVCKK